MLFLLPAFQMDTWLTTDTTFANGLRQLRDIKEKGNLTAFNIAYDKYVSYHTSDDIGYKLLFVNASEDNIWEAETKIDDLRTEEKGVA